MWVIYFWRDVLGTLMYGPSKYWGWDHIRWHHRQQCYPCIQDDCKGHNAP